MLTKVQAAKRAARSGAHTVIASGREPEVLVRLARGEAIGTFLRAGTVPLAARKQWLADHLTVAGRLHLDAGAVKALMRDGKSLLPIGGVSDRCMRPARRDAGGLPPAPAHPPAARRRNSARRGGAAPRTLPPPVGLRAPKTQPTAHTWANPPRVRPYIRAGNRSHRLPR